VSRLGVLFTEELIQLRLGELADPSIGRDFTDIPVVHEVHRFPALRCASTAAEVACLTASMNSAIYSGLPTTTF
jgi:hypothetical protein